jgi:hypothetical protein
MAGLSTPGKTWKRPNVQNANIDDFDRRVLKDVTEDVFTKKKIVPNCKKLLPVFKGRINFDWNVTTLRRMLKEMGIR